MKKHLILTFLTQTNKKYTVSIKEPKEDLTRAVAEAVAEKIISSQIFNTPKHTLKQFVKASYITREETILN